MGMGIHRARTGAALAGLLAATSLWAAPAPLEQDARIFGARATVWSGSLSPSGRQMVQLMSGPGASTVLGVTDLVTGTVKPLIKSSDASFVLNWCRFASESHAICEAGGNRMINDVLIPFSRMVVISTVDGSQWELGQRTSAFDASLRQYDGTIIDWLPQSDDQVLMARNYIPQQAEIGSLIGRSSAGMGVDRVDLKTRKMERVERPSPQVDGYQTDGKGQVRLNWKYAEGSLGMLTGDVVYRYRRQGSSKWEDLFKTKTDGGVDPLEIEAESDSLYYLDKVNGRQALFRMKLDGSMAKTQVASHPKVDIDGVIRLAEGQRVVGYRYTDDRTHAVYFDPATERLFNALSRALPKTPSIDIVSGSADGNKLLVHASGDTDPGRYYLLDRPSRKMEELQPSYIALEGRTLSPMHSIEIKAADGVTIPSYLTLPPGVSMADAKKLPTVVMPHGGPSARDHWGYDWLAQFVAARGYAVIQPNYRGSSGFGDDFQGANAFRNWRTAIRDIGDSVRDLAARGITDPARVAIVGWSYGGYAALQAAATEPSLYKSVVAVAPVTDFALLVRQEADYTIGNITKEMVGTGREANEASPLRHPEAIKVPVLLAHGDMDINVQIAHSDKMKAALERSGTSVEYLRYKGLDHQLDDSNARSQLLTSIGKLLDRTIGK